MKRSFTAEKGAAICIQACLEQIEAGRIRSLTTDDLGGPHQLRIGLRRLRTALGLFRDAIECPQSHALAEQAKWLGQQVGKTRDLEVVLYEIFETALVGKSGDEIMHPFLEGVRATRDQERTHLRKLLDGKRVASFLIALQTFVAQRGWLLREDISQTERLATPVYALGSIALQRCWKKTKRRAKNLNRLSVVESHQFRKDMKKLRYSVGFLASLYPARRVLPFLKRLNSLQTIYGNWNDAAIANKVFEAQIAQNFTQKDTLSAVVDVLEKLKEQAAARLAKAGKHWRALQKSGKPWA